MRLINAGDAYKVLIELYNLKSFVQCYALMEALDKVPTVDAEPVKHGRWIKMSDADGVFYGCSECGEWYKETSDYCPKCGAKMGSE